MGMTAKQKLGFGEMGFPQGFLKILWSWNLKKNTYDI